MFNRILRAFKNDFVLYSEIKGDPDIQSEAIRAILAIALLSAAITLLVGLFSDISVAIPNAIANFLGALVGYLIVVTWAWLIGSVLGPGEGSFTDVRTALAYGYAPIVFSGIPFVGWFFSLWALVTMSSAIRETLGVGKGLTFFIVITSLVFQFFVIFTTITSLLSGVLAL